MGSVRNARLNVRWVTTPPGVENDSSEAGAACCAASRTCFSTKGSGAAPTAPPGKLRTRDSPTLRVAGSTYQATPSGRMTIAWKPKGVMSSRMVVPFAVAPA